MEILYANKKQESICTSLDAAKRFFGGDKTLAKCLLIRINDLKSANSLDDIIVMKHFRFHKLKNKNGKDYEGYFAIDVKSKREPWRIILEPLNENKEPFYPCNIDQIAEFVRIVKIEEVSNHYE